MSTGFPNDPSDFKEQVRSLTDIVGLISESLTLTPQRGGQEFVGLCPFHDDHNPSMRVYPDRQTFRCWSCEAGGDCFGFVMQREGIGFREALELLAQRAGLDLPRRMSGGNPQQGDIRKKWYEALAWAEQEYHDCFLNSPAAEPARRYMTERGFTDETLRKFHVGCHPGGWTWLQDRNRGQHQLKDMKEVRLITERKSGDGFVDCFRGRVMFPIRDLQGRAVAFGGRILPGSDDANAPKYLNSQDSPLFIKSSLLYGLELARHAISKSGVAIVAEGYTDCIMCHQAGATNVVAPLGTALTEQHVTLLKRYARQVAVVFDGDEAGQRAADRSLSKFLAQDIDLRIMVIPDGKDPAEFLTAHGVDAFRELAKNAVDAWDYRLNAALEAGGAGSVDRRQRVVEELMQLAATVPRLAGTIREDFVCRRVAERIGMPEATVRRQLEEARRQSADRNRAKLVSPYNSRPNEEKTRPASPAAVHSQPEDSREDQAAAVTAERAVTPQDERLEREVLEVLLAGPAWLADLRTAIGPDDFTSRPLRQLFECCCDLADEGIPAETSALLLSLEDTELKRIAVGLDEAARQKDVAARLRETQSPTDTDVRPQFLQDIVDAIRWRRQKQEHEPVRAAATSRLAGDTALDAQARELLRQQASFHALRARKRTSN